MFLCVVFSSMNCNSQTMNLKSLKGSILQNVQKRKCNLSKLGLSKDGKTRIVNDFFDEIKKEKISKIKKAFFLYENINGEVITETYSLGVLTDQDEEYLINFSESVGEINFYCRKKINFASYLSKIELEAKSFDPAKKPPVTEKWLIIINNVNDVTCFDFW